ncbi:Suppressor of disruption of TFIIS [Micractinium conductrix]|uniref:Suppressor of disruption of TFIIS n=1 Tax=Micractinium conductrix TaxID=554055 RepID=A0A2P6V6S5_9CHLO|nr:Suppressor of disruption of TFIIS [Micractinium conductrix]|eukprot:PSC69793.1 Suppressor of disruption of TFIIS [Micractinium conductrix]
MTVLRRPRIEACLFDLDDCLYDNTAMQHQVAENIRHYMAERLGFPADEVQEKCADFYLNYGTTLAGLVAHGYQVDYDDWHAFVHGSLDYEKYLQPDPALRAMLDSLPLPKYVFTNADRAHAKRCLDLLGITECFIRVISFEEVMEAAAEAGLTHHGCPVVCKPNRQAFDIALQLAGSPTPGATLWADDSARNITTGHRMGLYSVLVGRTGVACPSDKQIRHIHELPAALPWLWEGQQPPVCAAPPLSHADGTGAADEGASGNGSAAVPAKTAGKAAAGGRSSENETMIEAVYTAA